eukprot:2813061-Pyramimonas_sp.AAC.1
MTLLCCSIPLPLLVCLVTRPSVIQWASTPRADEEQTDPRRPPSQWITTLASACDNSPVYLLPKSRHIHCRVR